MERNDKINQNLSEARTITFNDNYFAPEPVSPIESDFTLPHSSKSDIEEYPAVALVHRKQQNLDVLHECFGHLSFSIIKLMAQSGLISRELANADSPICTGCAYGKAHCKGVRNRKILNVATVPGQVVIVDQLVSPTPGFVPTYRGTLTTKLLFCSCE